MPKDNEPTQQQEDEFRREHFEMTAEADLVWYFYAEALKRAADCLYPVFQQANHQFMELVKAQSSRPDSSNEARAATDEENRLIADMRLDRVWAMLLGMAIEALAKGILASKQGRDVLDSRGRWKYRTHNLPALVSQCGIELRDPERNALSILTEYVNWKGRYPIPVQNLGYRHSHPPFKHETVKGIYDRLAGSLWCLYSNRINSANPPAGTK